MSGAGEDGRVRPPEIQVVMTAGIQPAFKAWLASRGLYLFPIPAEDDRLPSFGIGIGSR